MHVSFWRQTVDGMTINEFMSCGIYHQTVKSAVQVLWYFSWHTNKYKRCASVPSMSPGLLASASESQDEKACVACKLLVQGTIVVYCAFEASTIPVQA
jgi:hypothetical protein